MTSNSVAPSTIDGIKRLAKSIKRERNLPHHQALDLAAREAGFQNIRHAQHQLQEGASPAMPLPASKAVFLSAYWVAGGASGRETLRVLLPEPLTPPLTPSQMRDARNLAHFRNEYADHLERHTELDSQTEARQSVLAAARTLQFLAATGLRPASGSVRENLYLRFQRELPGHDHYSVWVDPASKAWVYLDEPYGSVARVRHDWVVRAGLQLIESAWGGLYQPGSTTPFLLCQSEGLADRLRAQLATLPPASTMRVDLQNWPGDSGSYEESYLSPERAAAGKKRAPRKNKAQASPTPKPADAPAGGDEGTGHLTDRELMRWATAHGWHYFTMNAQLRSPRGGLTTVENWDAIPSHIREQITAEMRASVST